jgi:geranylgeranyl reductase family protein
METPMKDFDYDVIIVGAGPAGSTTARYVKQLVNDARVLIIDRRKKIGVPVQCGEGLSKSSEWKKLLPSDYPIEELFSFPNEVIAQEIKHVEILSPKFKRYKLDYDGWILYRDCFDQYLAKMANQNKAETWLNTNVKGLKDRHNLLTSKGEVTSNIIVGADGPQSQIAKSIELKSPHDMCPLCPCAICIVEGDFHDDTKYLYFGKRFAGGYAWVFPKGDTANIGLGCGLIKQEKSLKKILDAFLKDIGISQQNVLYYGGGVIPLGGPIPQTVQDNVLIVGDAAGMVWPSTGGGIGQAMISGRECGIAIANHLIKDMSLNEYEYKWKNLLFSAFKQSVKEKNRSFWVTRHDILLELAFRLIGKTLFSLGGKFP